MHDATRLILEIAPCFPELPNTLSVRPQKSLPKIERLHYSFNFLNCYVFGSTLEISEIFSIGSEAFE